MRPVHAARCALPGATRCHRSSPLSAAQLVTPASEGVVPSTPNARMDRSMFMDAFAKNAHQPSDVRLEVVDDICSLRPGTRRRTKPSPRRPWQRHARQRRRGQRRQGWRRRFSSNRVRKDANSPNKKSSSSSSIELRQAPRDQYGLTSRSQRCARAHPPRAVQGLDSHTLRAAGGWMGGPRRRSDEGCVRRLTQRSERCAVSRQKSWLPHLVGFASEERG